MHRCERPHRWLAALGVAMLVMAMLGASGLRAADATPVAGEGAHWGYAGADGPAHWGELDPHYTTCAVGRAQSPIDIVQPVPERAGALTIAYQAISPLRITNNGHTIQIAVEPGNAVTLAGGRYELIQFHFHTPSEHEINEQRETMELHFVHQNDAGHLAVVGVLLKEGVKNTAFAPIFDHFPDEAGTERVVETSLDLTALLPTDLTFFQYDGSLTTPPCSEGVRWLVMATPVEVGSAQVAAFRALYTDNARPVQSLNGRTVEEEVVK